MRCTPLAVALAFSILGSCGGGGGGGGGAGGIPVGSGADAIVAADFNGDGSLDLATSNLSVAGSVSVLLGDGLGNFVRQADTPIAFPSDLTAADFDGDGKVDLAVASETAGSVSILRGRGDGTFDAPSTLDVSPVESTPGRLSAADFNEDGIPDLAVVGSNLVVYQGVGDGTFTFKSTVTTLLDAEHMQVARINGDAHLDIVISGGAYGSLAIMLGAGDGTFAKVVGTQPGPTGSAAVGDFNGDGKADLGLLGRSSGPLFVLLGVGDGTFLDGPTYSVGSVGSEFLLAGDFTGDGKLDLAFVRNNGNAVSFWRGAGDGTFAALATRTVGNSPSWLAAGDFDHSGISDVACVNNDIGHYSVSIILCPP